MGRTGYLGARIQDAERYRKGMLKAGEGTMDTELQDRLRALGYLY